MGRVFAQQQRRQRKMKDCVLRYGLFIYKLYKILSGACFVGCTTTPITLFMSVVCKVILCNKNINV